MHIKTVSIAKSEKKCLLKSFLEENDFTTREALIEMEIILPDMPWATAGIKSSLANAVNSLKPGSSLC